MINEGQITLRLVLSLILGGFVGLERQMQRRSAGLRTHILVCLGSSLIMLTSLYVFDIYKKIVPLNPTRIAAGVITGIGFLGAGAIISGEKKFPRAFSGDRERSDRQRGRAPMRNKRSERRKEGSHNGV